jgi:hypothetical protein
VRSGPQNHLLALGGSLCRGNDTAQCATRRRSPRFLPDVPRERRAWRPLPLAKRSLSPTTSRRLRSKAGRHAAAHRHRVGCGLSRADADRDRDPYHCRASTRLGSRGRGDCSQRRMRRAASITNGDADALLALESSPATARRTLPRCASRPTLPTLPFSDGLRQWRRCQRRPHPPCSC